MTTAEFVYPEIPFFEGAEKLLEIWFTPSSDDTDGYGLRRISRDKWEKLLSLVNCTIVGQTSNDYCDSYVLSESSMFITPYRFILKTCGTTTLLRAVPELLRLAREECGLDEVEDLFYSRQAFMKPSEQLAPHTSFEEEVKFLDGYFDGSAYTLGRLNGDPNWYLYTVAKKGKSDDQKEYSRRGADQTLEILMTELDHEAMKQFYKTPEWTSAKDVTVKTGIADLIPGATTDEVSFDPCGYSVNGLLDETYFTIHVTPQPECSYVSFETNALEADYTNLINKVTAIFKPGQFTVTVFANKEGPCGSSFNAYSEVRLDAAYRRTSKQFFVFDEYDLSFAHFLGKSDTRIS